MQKEILLLFISLGLGIHARAENVVQDQRTGEKTRAIQLGLGSSYTLYSSPLQGRKLGAKFQVNYHYFLKPKYWLGIHTSYTGIPTSQGNAHLVSYGLLMRHYLSSQPLVDESGFHPYLSYGLLLQVTALPNRVGSGTSHHTALVAGSDFYAWAQRWYFELGYHYSRIRYFEQASIPLDRLEGTLGWLLPF